MRLPASVLILSAAPLLASTAFAATLTLTPDKSTYSVNETIVLSIVGDSEGGTATGVQGYLTFDKQRVSWISTVQVPLTSFGGSLIWNADSGVVNFCIQGGSSPPGCPAFGQIIGLHTDAPVDDLLLATMTLTAVSPGLVDFAWLPSNDTTGNQLIFFGLSDAPGASITIIPEPATSMLLALGLLGLGARRRSGRA